MDHFFTVSLSLNSPLNQEQIRELFRHEGCDSIQTSNGICLKSQLDGDGVRALLAKNGMKEGFALSELRAEDAQKLGKDVAVFMGSTS